MLSMKIFASTVLVITLMVVLVGDTGYALPEKEITSMTNYSLSSKTRKKPRVLYKHKITEYKKTFYLT